MAVEVFPKSEWKPVGQLIAGAAAADEDDDNDDDNTNRAKENGAKETEKQNGKGEENAAGQGVNDREAHRLCYAVCISSERMYFTREESCFESLLLPLAAQTLTKSRTCGCAPSERLSASFGAAGGLLWHPLRKEKLTGAAVAGGQAAQSLGGFWRPLWKENCRASRYKQGSYRSCETNEYW